MSRKIHIPVFKPELKIQIYPPDLIFVLKDYRYEVIQSLLIYSVAPLIDGKNSAGVIAEKLQQKFSQVEVFSALWLLEDAGYLADSTQTTPVRAALTKRKISSPEYPLQITAVGGLDPTVLIETLKQCGVVVSKKSALNIVLTPDHRHPDLEKLHQKFMHTRGKWMIVRPGPNKIWCGPIFNEQGPCWKCLAMRLSERLSAEAFLTARSSEVQTLQESSNELNDDLMKLAGLEALVYLQNSFEDPGETMHTLNLNDGLSETHRVMKLAHCSDCGQPSSKARIVQISKCRKERNDSGYRSVSPKVTFQRYSHHINPITGIVSALKLNRYDRSGAIRSYVAEHLFVPPQDEEDLRRRGLFQKSAGKGISAEQARTSALCESLERYSGIFRGNEERFSASYEEIQDRAVHINELLNISDRQYNNREKLNRLYRYQDQIPVPLDEERVIEWTSAWSLTQKKFRYVPVAYCYYGYPLEPDHRFCAADSNGNAAGNTIEEAILQGFLELIERDATALWWLNRIHRSEIDIESFPLSYFKKLQNYYRSKDCKVWALDLTNDFNIPVIAAIAMQKETSGGRFIAGFGAHFDPLIALTRALTEMNQFLPRLLSKRISVRKLSPMQFLLPVGKSSISFRDFPKPEINNIDDAVVRCIDVTASKRMEMLVVDQTRSDIGLPVVKVIVPGLRHFRKRFGKGRLFDIPVQMKWIRKPLTEKRLNADSFLI